MTIEVLRYQNGFAFVHKPRPDVIDAEFIPEDAADFGWRLGHILTKFEQGGGNA